MRTTVMVVTPRGGKYRLCWCAHAGVCSASEDYVMDMGELLAHVPSSGYVALFRRTDPQVESGADAFARRWEAFSPHRDWEFVYTGGEMVMMLKPGSGAYRVLNCSAVYADQLPADAGANALGLPCAVMQDGALPEAATCAYQKDSCLMAPHCGWCEEIGRASCRERV